MKKGIRRALVLLLALSMVFTSTGLPVLAETDMYPTESVEDEALALTAESTALDQVLASIGGLSNDPRDFTAADTENVEAIQAAYDALSAEDQAVVDSTFDHPSGDGQSYGRILEAALWAARSFGTDTSTTLADGTYTTTTNPAVTSKSDKGKSDSSRVRNWWVESVVVENGQATAYIYVTGSTATAKKLTSYPSVWIGGQTIERNADNNYPIPVDLNGTTYFGGVSSSMPRPIMYKLDTTIDEPAAEEDADYSAVDAALATVPEDLSIYTDESAQAVTDAVNAVVRGKKASEQAEVDAMAAAINEAVAGLVEKQAEPEKIELAITNNTGMFKAVSAYLITEDGQEYLVMALSGSGYKELYKGTYEQAVANGDGSAENGNDSWIHGYTNDAGKLEFKIPVNAEDTYVPCVAVSNSYYTKYLNGQNSLERAYYPRQFELDREAKTLVTGDYAFTQGLTITNNVKMFKVNAAALNTVGGPNSNNYKADLELTMGSTSFDKAYIGRADEIGEGTATIALDGNNVFALPVKWVETFGLPETIKSLLGEPFVVSFHSVKNDAWYEREFTVSEEDGTLVINEVPADYSAVDAALATVPEDLSIYTDESAQAVTDAVNAVVRGKKASEQAEVDAMAKAISDAVAALEKKPADYSAVEAAKAKVPADLSIYTDETRQAVEEAVAAVVEGKKIDEQAAVDAMAQAIEDAVAALEKAPTAKTFVLGGNTMNFKQNTYTDRRLPTLARPYQLTLTARFDKKMLLQWTDCKQLGAPIDGYLVMRRVGSETAYTQYARVPATQNYLYDSGISKPNQNYYYIVLAYKQDASGNYTVSSDSMSVVGIRYDSSPRINPHECPAKNVSAALRAKFGLPTINTTKVTLKVGQTYDLKLTYPRYSFSTWTRWRSDKSNIATVNSYGRVTAKSPGTVLISGRTPNGRDIRCTVTVTP